jgi:hypothetical protein
MRFIFLAAFLIAASASAASAEDAPNARAAYVERRGLIESDAQCNLFSPEIRTALRIGAARTRGSLLRGGWTTNQVRQLEQTVVAAARGRACNDARTRVAAEDARAAFSVWVTARTMEFPGWRRTWIARRSTGGDGWRLSQAIESPVVAVFGVRDSNGAQRLTLVAPSAPASSATLVMRDPSRAATPEIGLPQRVAYGLEAGAPTPAAAASYGSSRAVIAGAASQTAYVFPDLAFRNLLALDPRESVEIRLQQGRRVHRLFVEVGDVAAARDFLTMH